MEQNMINVKAEPANVTKSSGKSKYISEIAPASLFYAVFFTFCVYKNASGIAYPFFVAGTIGFSVYAIRKAGISWKGGHILILAAGLLLGISNCLTDNTKIIFMNEAWLFVLIMYFLLAVYFDTEKWQLGKFLGNIVRLVIGSVGKIFSFFPDAQAWIEEHGEAKNSKVFYVAAGTCISVPLITVALGLLSSADIIFKNSVDIIFRNIDAWDVFCCIFWSIAMFFFSYGMAVFLDGRKLNETVKDYRVGPPIIAVSATAAVALIYVYFCAIQVVYLFAGYGTLPEGYTYAQYARQGFFQLLFICLMNLGLVLIGLGFFKESKMLKGILLIISLCTFIMTASSAYRMLLYISVYHLTFLRIFVLWALLVIALLMAGVVGKTFVNHFPLFRYGLFVITCCYLVLSLMKPDYWIARYNMQAYLAQEGKQDGQSTGEKQVVDTWYLSGLSADAAPAIINAESIGRFYVYEEEVKQWESGKIKEVSEPDWAVSYILNQKDRAEQMTLRSYNFSKGYVRRVMEKEQLRTK